MKKIMMVVMAVVSVLTLTSVKKAEAAEEKVYVTVEDLAKRVVKAVKKGSTYEDAIKAGLIKEGEYKNLKALVVNQDVAVILDRAYTLVYGKEATGEVLQVPADNKYMGNKLQADGTYKRVEQNNPVSFKDKTMVEVVKENNRISDIKKAKTSSRDAIYRMYAEGIMIGYSNGTCTVDRSFKPTTKSELGEVKTWIKRVIGTKECRGFAPDGQLTRTTDLPFNYKQFPYVLSSFPNKYYTLRWDYELYGTGHYIKDAKGNKIPYTLPEKDYPCNVLNYEWGRWIYDYHKQASEPKCVYEWDKWLTNTVGVVDKYLNLKFNVNYKTIGSDWIDGMDKCCAGGVTNSKYAANEYVEFVKKYKIKITPITLTADRSCIYPNTDGMSYFVRAYAKFKITWSGNPDLKRLLFDMAHLDSSWVKGADLAYLQGVKKGDTVECYFDVPVIRNGSGGGGTPYVLGEWEIDSVGNLTWLKKHNAFKAKELKPYVKSLTEFDGDLLPEYVYK